MSQSAFFSRSFAVLVLISLLGVSLRSVRAQEMGASRVISVVGEGSASQAPETITLNLNITSQDVTAATVFAKHDVAIAKLKQSLSDAGVGSSDVTEGNLTMNPTYDYSQAGQSPKLVGYHLMTPIVVHLSDINSLPHILDVATQSSASNVSIGGYGLKDKDYLRESATKAALKDARERASALAKQIGASLGEIISVSDMEAEAPGQMERERQMGGGNTLQKSVELKVVFGLK